MRVLWVCNVMLPVIAQAYGLEASNKEGWLSGLLDVILERQSENDVQLAVAFPAPPQMLGAGDAMKKKEMTVKGATFCCYGFREDTVRPDAYDERLEEVIGGITGDFLPDVVHCFGTEYPHTLATCRMFSDKARLLITIQGLCAVYADAYYANLPESVIRRVTFRDFLKKDDIQKQREKFVRRGEMEKEAVALAGNVGGRTPWDRHYAKLWNPNAHYYVMNETLRSNFYEGRWNGGACKPHSIFLSQGDYPIKGLHYVLLAMPRILEKYPDASVYVAGNGITAYGTFKEKLKISSYGKYLRQLIRERHLEGKVHFLGKLTSEQMKEQYLKSSLFLCPSSIENSPNSLGEAMLLGMPCVSADVGGVEGIFDDGRDGLLYRGFGKARDLEEVSGNLADAVLKTWEDLAAQEQYCENARAHAQRNHDRMENYRKTMEVYAKIAEGNGTGE